MVVDPANPALGNDFIAAVRELRRTNPGMSLNAAVRRHLLDSYDTDHSGRIDVNERTNLAELYSSLYSLSQNGSAEEKQQARAMLAALRRTLPTVSTQPPARRGDWRAVLQRIVNRNNIPTNIQRGSVWHATMHRNGGAFQRLGGMTMTLTDGFLANTLAALNEGPQRVPDDATPEQRGRLHFLNAMNNDIGGPKWVDTTELLAMVQYSTTLSSEDREAYIRGIGNGILETMREMPADQRGAFVYALELFRDGINTSQMGEDFCAAHAELADGVLNQIHEEFGIAITPRRQVAANLQIHFGRGEGTHVLRSEDQPGAQSLPHFTLSGDGTTTKRPISADLITAGVTAVRDANGEVTQIPEDGLRIGSIKIFRDGTYQYVGGEGDTPTGRFTLLNGENAVLTFNVTD